MFDHHKGPYRRPGLPLNDINLQNQDLSAAEQTWSRYIDFSTLRTLQIWNCSGVDNLLGSLIGLARTQPLQLEGVVLSFETARQAPLLAQDFLKSFSGLVYLNLCFPGELYVREFDVKCLTKHASTMRDLYIGIGSNRYSFVPLWQPTSAEMHWLVENFRNLRQLAVAMPRLFTDDVAGGKWDEYISILVRSRVTSFGFTSLTTSTETPRHPPQTQNPPPANLAHGLQPAHRPLRRPHPPPPAPPRVPRPTRHRRRKHRAPLRQQPRRTWRPSLRPHIRQCRTTRLHLDAQARPAADRSAAGVQDSESRE